VIELQAKEVAADLDFFEYVICKRRSFSCPRHNKPLETLQILYFAIIYTDMNDSIL
jgi:hypothetical protein